MIDRNLHKRTHCSLGHIELNVWSRRVVYRPKGAAPTSRTAALGGCRRDSDATE